MFFTEQVCENTLKVLLSCIDLSQILSQSHRPDFSISPTQGHAYTIKESSAKDASSFCEQCELQWRLYVIKWDRHQPVWLSI